MTLTIFIRFLDRTSLKVVYDNGRIGVKAARAYRINVDQSDGYEAKIRATTSEGRIYARLANYRETSFVLEATDEPYNCASPIEPAIGESPRNLKIYGCSGWFKIREMTDEDKIDL